MSSRAANSERYWYCEVCGHETPHRIHSITKEIGDEPTPSDWRSDHDTNLKYYWRERACEQCFTPHPTVELTEKEFKRLVKESKKLREIENIIQGEN